MRSFLSYSLSLTLILIIKLLHSKMISNKNEQFISEVIFY